MDQWLNISIEKRCGGREQRERTRRKWELVCFLPRKVKDIELWPGKGKVGRVGWAVVRSVDRRERLATHGKGSTALRRNVQEAGQGEPAVAGLGQSCQSVSSRQTAFNRSLHLEKTVAGPPTQDSIGQKASLVLARGSGETCLSCGLDRLRALTRPQDHVSGPDLMTLRGLVRYHAPGHVGLAGPT